MNVLVMNPGGNSLKVELISCLPEQQFAFEGRKLLSLTVEGIGKKPGLSVLQGKEVTHSEEIEARDYGERRQIFFPGWRTRSTSAALKSNASD